MPQSKENRVARYLRERIGSAAPPLPLRGDASARSFFRLPYGGGTAVAMVGETGGEDADNFLETRALLASCGAAVPAVYDIDRPGGVILLEDLGDCTLEERLRRPGADVRGLYRRAIDQLLAVHLLGTVAPRDAAAFRRAFDREKLVEELDFFLLNTVEGLFRTRLSGGEREAVRGGFAALAGALADLPRVLCHRDYHSRNLMVTDGRIRILDFQDARMGPCQYDLVSLLRDSYTVLDAGLREELLDYYLDRSASMGVAWRDRGEFIRRFDLAGVQRNLKACGTFGHMATARGLDRYLPSLAPTFAYVRETAPRLPEIDAWVRVLARHLPPLRGDGEAR
ncbi:MAG: phosphotransferase [bacterium]|nr:phosphotransferase [bacterium]